MTTLTPIANILTNIDVLAATAGQVATTNPKVAKAARPELADRVRALIEFVLERTTAAAKAQHGIKMDDEELRFALRDALGLPPYALQDDTEGDDARFMHETFTVLSGAAVLGLLRLRAGEEIRRQIGGNPSPDSAPRVPFSRRLAAAWIAFTGGAA